MSALFHVIGCTLPQVVRRLRTSALLCLLLVLVAGCTSVSEQARDKIPEAVEVDAAGEPSAIDALLLRAARTTGDEAVILLLQAAELMLAEGEIENAGAIVNFIDTAGLTDELKSLILLLQAEVAAASQMPEAVITLLRTGNFRNLERLPAARQIRYHELRAQAQFETGETLQSALERIQLDRLLMPAAQVDNHELIWQALAELPQAQLESLAAAALNFEVQGWYQLALIARSYSNDLDHQLIELLRWRNGWTRHPAASVLPREMQLAEIMARERPQQLALLLPLATPVGSVVRDAFMSAYFNLLEIGGQVPSLRFYDTSNVTDILAVHQQARADGAQMIIGPLQKQHVAELQKVDDLGVPTLALNNVDGVEPASPLLYQFALSPESEARQLANKAWRDGHRFAAVLSPLDDIGNDTFARKRDSFIAEWERLGGRVVVQDIYNNDYTKTISAMLELDASSARMENVRDLIGRPVLFVQRRRQDIDFIYLIAQPAPARQIVPSLAYLYAGDIPVYASQDVYSGMPRPLEDRDINGVTFGDSPWLLDSTGIEAGRIRELFPASTAQNLRLQAFGLDAFRLYPRLRLLESSAESRMPGATGILRLRTNRNIERELTWATITEGLAQPQPQVR